MWLYVFVVVAFAGYLELGAAEDVPSSIGEGGLIADPIIVPFDGSKRFFFNGVPGKHYNLVSDDSGLYQVSFKTKLGVMFDHNGTYMEGLALRYGNSTAVAEVTQDSQMRVHINGAEVQQLTGTKNISYPVHMEGNLTLNVTWSPHVPGVGTLVTLATDDFVIEVQAIPAGLKDRGGVLQPSYLNMRRFSLKCTPPSGFLQGILGETYPSAMGPNPSKKVGPDGIVETLKLKHPVHPDAFYEVAGYPVLDSLQPASTQRRRVLGSLRSPSERHLTAALEGSMSHSLL